MRGDFKKKRVFVDKSRFFWGETATCIMCGAVKTFDPQVESNWTVLEVDYTHFYVCDKELPLKNGGGSSDEFSVAYRKIMAKILELLDKWSVTE